MKRGLKIGLAVAGVMAAAVGGSVLWAMKHPFELYQITGKRALEKAGLLKGASHGLTVFRGQSNTPAVILIHGVNDQAGTWSYVVPKLPARRLVLLDLPGHGESGPRSGPLALGGMKDALVTLVDEEAKTGPVTLVGNSMGAWLACLVALERPAAVARLVLVNGGPLRTDKPVNLIPRTREEARAVLAGMRDPSAPAVPDFVLDGIVELGRSGPVSRLSIAELERFLLDGRAGELKTPVDLLWGASDQAVPLSYAERLLKELPHARLTKLERCGHVPQQECPVRFAEALSKVLSEAPPS